MYTPIAGRSDCQPGDGDCPTTTTTRTVTSLTSTTTITTTKEVCSKKGDGGNWACTPSGTEIPCSYVCDGYDDCTADENVAFCAAWNNGGVAPEAVTTATSTSVVAATSTTTATAAVTATTSTDVSNVDVDCVETISLCTAACEAASTRVYTVQENAFGNGRTCDGATDCSPGDDLCVTPTEGPADANNNAGSVVDFAGITAQDGTINVVAAADAFESAASSAGGIVISAGGIAYRFGAIPPAFS